MAHVGLMLMVDVWTKFIRNVEYSAWFLFFSLSHSLSLPSPCLPPPLVSINDLNENEHLNWFTHMLFVGCHHAVLTFSIRTNEISQFAFLCSSHWLTKTDTFSIIFFVCATAKTSVQWPSGVVLFWNRCSCWHLMLFTLFTNRCAIVHSLNALSFYS